MELRDLENDESLSHLTAQERLIVATVVSSKTRTDAARRLNMSRSTLYRYLQLEDVKAAIDELENANYQAAVHKVMDGAETAANVLLELATNPKTPAYVRHSASRSILDLTLALRTQEEVEAKLKELEARL